MSVQLLDQKILWSKAAGRCSMPDCRKKLALDASDAVPSKSVLIGENAHIVGDKKTAARGDSPLSAEDRDRYPNLILLCRNHHREVDRDPAAWPIELLHQVKADHEWWVESRLVEVEDVELQVYADLIDLATDGLRLSSWEHISDHAVRLLLRSDFVAGVDAFYKRVLRTNWTGRLPEFEGAIQNLSERAGAYVYHFLSRAHLRDEQFFVEDKSWKREGWHPERWPRHVEASNTWSSTSTQLLFNLAHALNEFADRVRADVKPEYMLLEGRFAIDDELGVVSDGVSTTYLPNDYFDTPTMAEIGSASS